MKAKLKLILLLLALIGFSHAAFGFHVKDIYVLGDSLSDIGNNTTECAPPLFPFSPGGPCTNFPRILWPEFVAGKYGIGMAPSIEGGTDFSYAGAATNIGGTDIIPVNQQVDMMINSRKGKLDPDGLYVIWAGGDNIITVLENNPFTFTDAELLQAATQAATDIRRNVIKMHNAGAQVIVVGNTPDLSRTPIDNIIPASELARIREFGIDPINSQELQGINSLPFDVIQIDFFSFFNDVFNNPRLYGFSDSTGFCLQTNTTCPGYLFTYVIHPTVAAHIILADYIFSIFNAPVFYAKLATVSINSMTSQMQAIEQRLMPFIPRQRKRQQHLFVIGSISPLQQPTQSDVEPRSNYDLYNGTIGYTYFVNRLVEVGGAYSHGYTDLNLDNNVSHANIQSNLFSAFASYYPGKYYVYSIVGGGLLDYDDIDRHIVLGPRPVDARGSTHGYIFGISANSGWFIMERPQMRTGPYVQTTYGHADVDGYTEFGAPQGVNIQYNDQTQNSVVSSLGWRFDYDRFIKGTKFIATVFASGSHQWIGDRNIHFHIASLPGSHGFLPVSNNQTTFFTAGFNLTDQLLSGLIIALGYNVNVGSYNVFGQNINLALSIPLA